MRRRSSTVRLCTLAVVLGGALLTGCADGGDADGNADDRAASEDVPAATERCAAVEFPPVQFGSHLIGDAEPPVAYSSTPPSSGWHLSGAPPTGVHSDPLSEPAQVSTLEAGGIVVTHRGLSPSDVAALTAVAEAHPNTIAMTPYDGIGAGEVVFASWGALQRCEGVDTAALDAYVDAYGEDVTTFEESG